MCVVLTSRVCIRLGLMASFISTVSAPLTPCREMQQGIMSAQYLIRRSRQKGACGTDQVLGGDGRSSAAGGHDHLGQTLTHVLHAAGEGEHRHDLTGHCDVKLSLENRADINKFINKVVK